MIAPASRMLRRVTTWQINEHGAPTAAAFLPGPRDLGLLSVFRSPPRTPDQVRQAGNPKYQYSIGSIADTDVQHAAQTMGCALPVLPDNPPHNSIDFRGRTPEEATGMAALLASAAIPPTPWPTFSG